MAEDPRSGFTEVQGIRMHYREWGDPSAPDFLLIHGWTNYSLGWAGVAEHFAGRYHVVAADRRGHGESDKLRSIASPRLAFEFWEGVGHMMRGTRPEVDNERLEQWLAGV